MLRDGDVSVLKLCLALQWGERLLSQSRRFMKQPGWRTLQVKVLHKPLLTMGSKGAARAG